MFCRTFSAAMMAVALAGCASLPKISYDFSFGNDTKSELNIAEDREQVLAVAKRIIEDDAFMTFVSVDENGQPRARTVEHKKVVGDDFVVWFATIPGTRKLDQIRANSKVTLYFDGPAEFEYVTIMGRASIHIDRETVESVTWRDKEERDRFWPEFPNDYVLVRIAPRWLEVVSVGEGIDSRDSDWRPQAVVFE